MPWHDTDLLILQGENAIYDLLLRNDLCLKKKKIKSQSLMIGPWEISMLNNDSRTPQYNTF